MHINTTEVYKWTYRWLHVMRKPCVRVSALVMPFHPKKPKSQSHKYCANFGWQRVHFLHRGYSGAVFCIRAENKSW